MTVIHCRKYWIDFKGGILLSRIIVLMPVLATPRSIIILSIPLTTPRWHTYELNWMLDALEPKPTKTTTPQKTWTTENPWEDKNVAWFTYLSWQVQVQRMSFFVKQVHRCLASRDSSTCVVILKPTSATRHQRHVQSWAVCRFVFSC